MTTNLDLLIEHAMINSGIPNEGMRIAITREDFEILKNPKKLYEEGVEKAFVNLSKKLLEEIEKELAIAD